MEFDRNQIQLVRELGSGMFGEIWEGLWKDKTSVAVRVMKSRIASPAKFLHYAKLMKRLLCHPNIVQLYGVCAKEESSF